MNIILDFSENGKVVPRCKIIIYNKFVTVDVDTRITSAHERFGMSPSAIHFIGTMYKNTINKNDNVYLIII